MNTKWLEIFMQEFSNWDITHLSAFTLIVLLFGIPLMLFLLPILKSLTINLIGKNGVTTKVAHNNGFSMALLHSEMKRQGTQIMTLEKRTRELETSITKLEVFLRTQFKTISEAIK